LAEKSGKIEEQESGRDAVSGGQSPGGKEDDPAHVCVPPELVTALGKFI